MDRHEVLQPSRRSVVEVVDAARAVVRQGESDQCPGHDVDRQEAEGELRARRMAAEGRGAEQHAREHVIDAGGAVLGVRESAPQPVDTGTSTTGRCLDDQLLCRPLARRVARPAWWRSSSVQVHSVTTRGAAPGAA
ncbi:hypothetical protein O1L68_43550 [Streptomyces lydicus]|nr:hypothetical protein [Streptomyces lydicus]